jgi:hypothetical protein
MNNKTRLSLTAKYALLLSGVILFTAGLAGLPVQAKAEDNQGIPPGMELIKVGSTDVLIPRGTRVTQRGSQLILESPERYLARKIQDLEKEIARLKDEQERIKEDLEELKQSVNQNAPPQKE